MPNLTRAFDLATLAFVKGPEHGRQDEPERDLQYSQSAHLRVKMSLWVALGKMWKNMS